MPSKRAPLQPSAPPALAHAQARCQAKVTLPHRLHLDINSPDGALEALPPSSHPVADRPREGPEDEAQPFALKLDLQVRCCRQRPLPSASSCHKGPEDKAQPFALKLGLQVCCCRQRLLMWAQEAVVLGGG